MSKEMRHLFWILTLGFDWTFDIWALPLAKV